MKKRLKVEAVDLSPWQMLLNEIICGNTFGADRIDYLLRDSWHSGVAYGRFDPDRLIAGLTPVIDPTNEEITIGLDIGAIHTAEALLLARYFMYTQVYFHDVRRVYDLHLMEFLQAWLPNGKFPTDWRELLAITDHEVLAGMRAAARDKTAAAHSLARRTLSREHFRTVYELVSTHKRKCPTIFDDLKNAVEEKFGVQSVRSDRYGPKSETNDFVVQTENGGVESSRQVSGVIANVPAIEIGLIFVEPQLAHDARTLVTAQIQERTQPRKKRRKGP